jgi:hypothetical protein
MHLKIPQIGSSGSQTSQDHGANKITDLRVLLSFKKKSLSGHKFQSKAFKGNHIRESLKLKRLI